MDWRPSSPALYALTASQTALLVAVPVLLGSLARLPMGMLTDRFGGRSMFTALLAFSCARRVARAADRAATRRCSRARSSSAWRARRLRSAPRSCPGGRRRRGRAPRSASTGSARSASRWRCSAARSSPRSWGGRPCFAAPARCSLIWAVVFVAVRAQSRRRRPSRAGRGDGAVLRRAPKAWLLGAFYFLTFGGFVAFSIYLPTLLRAQFGLTPADAGFPRGRLRRARDADAAGRRLAGGSHRRRAGAVVGLRRRRAVLAAADVAVDGAVHRGRARLRAAPGPGQRRGLQARAGAFSRRTPAPSPDWSARSADSADSFLRCCWASFTIGSARSGPASCCCRRRRWRCAARTSACSVPADVEWTRSLPVTARQALERMRAGAWATLVMAGARRSDRRRLAQSAALRRGARRLHVRDAVCGVRHQLPLCDVAAAAADADVLAARLAGVLRTPRRRPQHGHVSAAARSWSSPRTLTSSTAGGCAGSRTG